MARVLVTGAAGFVGGYVVEELLALGHEVVGLDDLSKYGPVRRSYEEDDRYRFIEADARDPAALTDAMDGCDLFLALAAKVGGIPYIARYPYDVMAANDRITLAACDVALRMREHGTLQKVVYVSSCSVFDSASSWPSVEGDELKIPPSPSSYGLQKLAVEAYAKAAWAQYGLPYTIVRPSNVVGIGETRARDAVDLLSGGIRLATAHVLPDLVQKALRGQDPLRVLGDGGQVRHYTHGRDVGRGIVAALFHPAAVNEDFNLAGPVPVTVRELAVRILEKVRGQAGEIAHDAPIESDVAQRRPDAGKAERLLGWRAVVGLDETLDEVIPWTERALADGRL